MLTRVWLLSVLLACTLCPLSVTAQVNYKSTMPDGKVIYGDKPVPGAVKVDQLKAAPTKGITGPSSREAAVLRDMEKSRNVRNSRDDRIRAAEQALKKAEAALAAGKEQQDGDRIGTAGGGSRVTEGYLERVNRLEQDVVRARAELDAARVEPVAQKSRANDPDAPPTARSKRWQQDK